MTEPLFPESFLRKIERLALVAERAEGAGGVRGAPRGGKLEFADHRAYAPGDDLRYVDWHLFGRLGRLFLKEFAREEQAGVVLVLDTSASMAGKLRGALRFAAALLVVALARGDRARFATAADGGLTVSRVIEGSGRRGELLDRLAAVEGTAGGATDLDRSLARLPAERGGGRTLLLLVSDLLAEADGRRALAARREERFVFHWLAPEERTPPPYGRARLADAEGGSLDVFVGPEEAARYAEEMERHLDEVRSSLARHGIRYLLTPAERDTEELVLDLLVAEGVLR